MAEMEDGLHKPQTHKNCGGKVSVHLDNRAAEPDASYGALDEIYTCERCGPVKKEEVEDALQ